MSNVSKQIEITVQSGTNTATLGKLMAITVSCGAEVLAASSHWDRTGGAMRLVTEDGSRTMRALSNAGYTCRAAPVVLIEVPDKPGLAVQLGRKLTDAGIAILYAYTFHSDDDRCYVVFRTDDDDRALYLLELDAMIHDLAAAKSWQPSLSADGRGA